MEKVAVIRAHPDIADDVAHIGLDVLSLANNHTFDFGPAALDDTIKVLQNAGSRTLGAGANLAEATDTITLDRNGIRVGFVAFSCLVPPGAAATESGYGISAIRVHSSYQIHPAWSVEEPGEPEVVQIHTWVDPDDEKRALEQVRSLKEDVDIVVASVHWGFGAGERLADYQRPLGQALVGAGADVVFGHHVHGVQGIEVYEGRPILYSPGTFLGRQQSEDPATLSDLAQRLIADMTPDGYIARLMFDSESPISLVIVPTTHNEEGMPRPATGTDFDRVVDRLVRGSSKLGTQIDIDEGRLVVKLHDD